MRLLRAFAVSACALVLAWPAPAPPRRTAAKPKPAPAQPPPYGFPLAAITVEGNRRHAADKIIAVSGLKLGARVDKPDFESARDRLLASGYFETAGYRYNRAPGGAGYTAVLIVQEMAEVYAWRIDGLPAASGDFLRLAQSRDPLFDLRIPATRAILDRAARWIEELLAAAGKRESVLATVEPETNEVLVIQFRSTAPPPVIAEVRFTGMQAVDEGALRRAMNQIAIGEPYTERRYRTFLDQQLRGVYEARGRLAVRFPKITTAPSPAVKGLIVTTEVAEGDEFKLKQVDVTGAPLEPEAIRREAAFKIGETANFSDVGLGIERILTRLRNIGYVACRYTARRTLDERAKTVSLAIEIDPGPQYKLGRLTIAGLDIQTEPYIRKLWTLQPGAPFDQSYPDLFLRRIRDGGVLDFLGETKSEVRRDEARAMIDVTLTFKGAPQPLDSRDTGQRRRPPL